jgi:hypothetical protein
MNAEPKLFRCSGRLLGSVGHHPRRDATVTDEDIDQQFQQFRFHSEQQST